HRPGVRPQKEEAGCCDLFCRRHNIERRSAADLIVPIGLVERGGDLTERTKTADRGARDSARGDGVDPYLGSQFSSEMQERSAQRTLAGPVERPTPVAVERATR